MSRTQQLKALLERAELSTQAEIAAALSAAGHPVNQATISRELHRLGVRKVEGIYRLPQRQAVAPILHSAVTASGCLAVLHTEPAFASVLAQRIDRARLDGVLGTIAGDDTVFVALTGPDAASGLHALLGTGPSCE